MDSLVEDGPPAAARPAMPGSRSSASRTSGGRRPRLQYTPRDTVIRTEASPSGPSSASAARRSRSRARPCSATAGNAIPSPPAERLSRATCSSSLVTRPARARRVSNTASPSWKPRSKTDRCAPSPGSTAPSTHTCPAASLDDRSRLRRGLRRLRSPRAGRALATVSAHSAAGSLPHVMPPPTCVSRRRPPRTSGSGSRSASHRRGRSSRAHLCTGRGGPARGPEDLHRPDLWRAGDGSAGERGGEEVEGVVVVGEDAGHRRNEVLHRDRALEPTQARDPTLPGRQTRPRSLRRTSTIITFSARSFALASSSQASARSVARSRPRGRVPLIGLVVDALPVDGQERLGGRGQERAGRPVSGLGPRSR